MSELNTGGGANVGRDVSTGGGGFVGRDEQRNSITINNDDDAALWRAVANLEMRVTILEHDARNNARQYLFAIILFIVVIVSIWLGVWIISARIDNYTKAAQSLSRLATEQRK